MAKFRVELEGNDWTKVLNVLITRPYGEVAQLVQSISQQLSAHPPVPAANGEAQPAQQAANG